MRRDLFEHCNPLTGDALLVQQQPRQIASGPRYARNQSRANRIRDLREYDGDRARLALERSINGCRITKDDVGLQGDQFLCKHLILIRSIGGKTGVDTDVTILRPPELLEPPPKFEKLRLGFRIVVSVVHQYAYAPRLAGLLRLCRARPCRCRTADKPDELAALHGAPRDRRFALRSLALWKRAVEVKFHPIELRS